MVLRSVWTVLGPWFFICFESSRKTKNNRVGIFGRAILNLSTTVARIATF